MHNNDTPQHDNRRHTGGGGGATAFTAACNAPLIEVVMKCLDGISRTKAKTIIAKGAVTIDGTVMKQPTAIVSAGAAVRIAKKPSVAAQQFDYSPYFSVVYEDDDVIVVNKAADVLSADVGTEGPNLKDLLDKYFTIVREEQCRAHLVHRLDARTTGLMMYAKSARTQQALTANWRKTIIDRRYVAVVEGEMEQDAGSVKSWLKDTDTRKMLSSRHDNGGKWAHTDWRVLRRHDGLTLVELHLHTGRKNQIRAHMSDLHHPIVGDYKYGARIPKVMRLCLHAYKLAFYHPRSHKPLSFETPVPPLFEAMMRQ